MRNVIQYAMLIAIIIFLLWLLNALQQVETGVEMTFFSTCRNGVRIDDFLLSKAEEYAQSYLEANVNDKIDRYVFMNTTFDFNECKLRMNYLYRYHNLTIPMHLDVEIVGTYVYRISDSSEILLIPAEIEVFPWQVNVTKIHVTSDDIIYETPYGNISALERENVKNVLQ